MDREEKKRLDEAEKKYPGVAVDVAGGDKNVSQKMVDEEIKSLNNNPRNDQ